MTISYHTWPHYCRYCSTSSFCIA